MNKFNIFSCIEVREDDYEGPCVVMACASDTAFMLFFPISKDNAKIISYVMDGNDDYDINTHVLGIYKTMIDTWKSSDRYLSGIIMDSSYDEEMDEQVLMIRLALASSDGQIDSLVRVNFLHAILIAAMEDVSLIVSDDLIEQMLPSDSPEDVEDEFFDKRGRKSKSAQNDSEHFVGDSNIVDIARKIMSGKIKERDNDKDSDKDKEKE